MSNGVCCTYHQLKYLSPNRSKKKKKGEKKKSHTKEPTFRKKWRLREEEVRRGGQARSGTGVSVLPVARRVPASALCSEQYTGLAVWATVWAVG